jgi:hypothetical protein
MNHIDDYESRVICYADGELDSQEAAAFEAHLLTCEDCAHVLQEHQESLRIMQSALSNPPQADRMSIHPLAWGARRYRRRMGLAVATACGLTVIAATVFGLVNMPQNNNGMFAETVPPIEAEPTELELRIALLEAELAAVQAELGKASERSSLADHLASNEFASIAVAAAQHLEESGLDHEGAREQYRFVIDHYAGSPAATLAGERLSAMTNNLSTT